LPALIIGMKLRFPHRRPKQQPPRNIEETPYTPHPLTPGTWLGEYEIGELLNQTRSGYTYAANRGTVLVQEYFPSEIAIRDLDGTSVLLHNEGENSSYEHGLSQFLLLARVLCQIDHPGRVVHYQEQHDTAWYAVNFEPRVPLGDLLNAGKRLPEESLQAILDATLIYLDVAHQNEIFHLELGPEQLILSSEEELVLCGFNVARLLGADLDKQEAAYYFAPEHLHTAGRLGPWTDFYSLGSILYQGLDPKIPPTAARRLTALHAGRADPLIPATKLGKGYYSEEFLQVVDWLLHISTGDRPKSVEHLIRDIDPDGPMLRILEPEVSVAFGPAYDGNQKDVTPSRLANDPPDDNRTKATASDVSPNVPKLASDPVPTGVTGLAVAALNTASKNASSPRKVADALEQTARILEPADSNRRWANRPTEQAESIVSVAPTDNRLTSPDIVIPDERSAWRTLLRPRTFSSARREPNRHANQVDDSNPQLNIKGITARKGKVHLRSNRVRSQLFLLFLMGATLIAGIWFWQAQSKPITEPTRIKILGLMDRMDEDVIEHSTEPRTTAELDSTIDAISNDTEAIRLVDSLLADARLYTAERTWFGNNDTNAYAAYRKALLLAPSNPIAKEGLDELVKQSLIQISSNLDQTQLDQARALIAALRERTLAVGQLPRLEKRAQEIEDSLRQAALAQALSEEQQQKEASIRREKINNLLNRASNAFENGNLIQPQGENALTLYRAALDLDRNNQRARNGINSVGDHFVQQARMALATADLNRAKQNLQRAASVRKNDLTILRLQQQLVQRRDLLRQRQEIQAELAAKQAEARRLALEQTKINLKSGVEAYYRGNFFEAYSFLYPLAENGIARAQVRVANMLLQGRGVSPNKVHAKEWFLKALNPVQLAAARGKAWAQSDYGDYYADGIVIPQDFRQAVIWYRRAANQRYSPAQTNLGLMHMHGSGVRPDWNEAIEWFRMAAAQGNYAAQENLRLLEVQPSDAGS
jgi:TPR repeat protein/serine/threonine protein kinase